MDAFRLLSRSTNLTKPSLKNHKKSSSHPIIPSAGPNPSPQLFGRITEEPKQTAPPPVPTAVGRSRKRKRGQKTPDEVVQLPAEVDFFTEAPAPRSLDFKADDEKDKAGVGGTNGELGNTQACAQESAGQEWLPESECKAVLKRHKIKVMRLADDSFESTTRGKTKTKDKHGKRRAEELFPQPLLSFDQLRRNYGISRRLAQNISAQGYTVPTEVQMASIPLLLRTAEEVATLGVGESGNGGVEDVLGGPDVDLMTVAPTGSGKTLAFLIPVLEGLILGNKRGSGQVGSERGRAGMGPSGPRAIIVAPTRELVGQIVNEGRKLGVATGIRITAMRKGMRLTDQVPISQTDDESSDDESHTSGEERDTSSRKDGSNTPMVKADVLVTTPLALLNGIKQVKNGPHLKLPSVKYLVLDEADVLLDPLFREQTMGVWNACSNPHLRVSFWSATMGSSIEELVRSELKARRAALAPSSSSAPWQLIRVVVGIKDSALPNLSHRLIYAATEPGKLLALRQLLHPSGVQISSSSSSSGTSNSNPPPLRPPFLVFTQTVPRAIALHAELLYDIPLEAGGSTRLAVLHADLSDAARDRVMTRFRTGHVWVLITTDLLSRGVDFRGLNGVVNYDVPNSAAAYIHRAGRTGRAGREGGVVVTLYTREDIPYVKNVANVVAAVEAVRGKGEGNGKGEGGGEGALQGWLLDALPRVRKADKKRLKRQGVEARRPRHDAAAVGVHEQARVRISTKSGYDRRLENKRRGAPLGGGRKTGDGKGARTGTGGGDAEALSGNESEWGGIED